MGTNANSQCSIYFQITYSCDVNNRCLQTSYKHYKRATKTPFDIKWTSFKHLNNIFFKFIYSKLFDHVLKFYYIALQNYNHLCDNTLSIWNTKNTFVEFLQFSCIKYFCKFISFNTHINTFTLIIQKIITFVISY